ncbi:unnamed protein product, partial [marine sediment metagenome]
MLLIKEVESTGITIEGPEFNEATAFRTGIIAFEGVYVNKSYSNAFKLENPSDYSWDINQNGDLVVSGLNYTEGDMFKVAYYAYDPVNVIHSL